MDKMVTGSESFGMEFILWLYINCDLPLANQNY